MVRDDRKAVGAKSGRTFSMLTVLVFVLLKTRGRCCSVSAGLGDRQVLGMWWAVCSRMCGGAKHDVSGLSGG